MGLDPLIEADKEELDSVLSKELRIPSSNRIRYIGDAFRAGFQIEKIFELTGIDIWFLHQIQDIVHSESEITGLKLDGLSLEALMNLKKKGFSDARLGSLLGCNEKEVRKHRLENDIKPIFKRVDTCAAEFKASTAYMYSTYGEVCEANPSDRQKIIILGGGPNRIGQGIEFDYCCVHAALAVKSEGYEAIMINCNPETVSTDYDTSDRLFFEPLTFEDVMSVIDLEKPKGVIVQFGGQTPLKLANGLEEAGVSIIGTSPDAIDEAEDRKRFQLLINSLDLRQPANETVQSKREAIEIANKLGFPLIARPSYVLGGRAMELVYDQSELKSYMEKVEGLVGDSPVLLDRFLDQAIEVDVDAVSDGKDVVIGSVMEHIEQAGIHSGDSACSLPPFSLDESLLKKIRDQVGRMAKHLRVCGLMNVQLAIQGDDIYVLEVNPRASRTVPFVSKCIGTSLAKVAAKCMLGVSLEEQQFLKEKVPHFYSVKEAVFPFGKFPGVDPILGPEMKSTGEVMGVGLSFAEAYGKAQMAANEPIPSQGNAFLSVRDADKPYLIDIARNLTKLGFSIVATRGTGNMLKQALVEVKIVNKVQEGRPHIVDMLKNNEISFIVNTTEGKQAIADSFEIRRTALQHKVCYTTTIAGGKASVEALMHGEDVTVRSLQSLKN